MLQVRDRGVNGGMFLLYYSVAHVIKSSVLSKHLSESSEETCTTSAHGCVRLFEFNHHNIGILEGLDQGQILSGYCQCRI